MEQLLDILRDINPDVDYETEQHLIDGGLIDSLAMVELIAQISDEFDVVITAKDILPENFNSAQALYALITRLQEE